MQWAGSLNMRPMPAECTSALGGWCGGPGLPTTVLPVRPPRLFSPPEATVPGQLETAPGNGAEFAAPAVGGGGAGYRSASVPGKRRGAHKGEAAPPGGPCRRQRGGEWREPVAAGCSRQDGVTSPHGHLGPAPPPPAVRQVSPAAGRIWAWGAAVWGAQGGDSGRDNGRSPGCGTQKQRVRVVPTEGRVCGGPASVTPRVPS